MPKKIKIYAFFINAVLKRAVINRISGDYTLMSLASEVAFWTFIVAGGWAFSPSLGLQPNNHTGYG